MNTYLLSFLAIISKTAVSIGVQAIVSVCLHSLASVLKSGVAKSHDKCMSSLITVPTVFQSHYTILQHHYLTAMCETSSCHKLARTWHGKLFVCLFVFSPFFLGV